MGNWFYNYQTLLVGGFGFAGVMATLWINAWLQREQHKRDLQKSRQERTEARAEAASALRSALYQELKILSATMQSSIRSTDRVEREGFKGTIFTLVPGIEVYKAYIGKIDLLTSYEILKNSGRLPLARDVYRAVNSAFEAPRLFNSRCFRLSFHGGSGSHG